MMENRGVGRRGGGPTLPMNRVTRNAGMNRFVWDVRHSNGFGLPPGQYQARLTVDGKMLAQPFTVLMDPLLAAEGLTAADIQQQFDHNVNMRALVQQVTALVSRVRQAQTDAKSKDDMGLLKQLDAIAAKLITEPVRYGKPGLQAHVSYLANMTTGVDQKVGKDALDRYAVLKKEHDAILAELDKITKK